MTIDLEKFKPAYERWVEESLPDYMAGKIEKVVKNYPFVVPDGIPWTPYSGDPSKQTFALLSSGGLYLKDSQSPFETQSIHGDTSFREIPKTVCQEDVGIAHAHYDHALALEDVNTIFPIHRLTELESEGVLGKVSDVHFSFSYVNDVVTLISEAIPALISRLKSQEIDVLLLVPV